MKKVYFVRHGQSEGNVGIFFQGPDEPLTELGQQQAEYMAARALHLPVEYIVASPQQRAKTTAETIAKKINKPLEFSDLFIERRRPSEQLGQLWIDPKALEIDTLIKQNFTTPGWRYSDEENFDDLKERAKLALEFLETRIEENILVVTHGYFMRMIVATVVFGDELTAREAENFARTFHMENTGLSVLGYNEAYKQSPWWLWVWNDHAHLG